MHASTSKGGGGGGGGLVRVETSGLASNKQTALRPGMGRVVKNHNRESEPGIVNILPYKSENKIRWLTYSPVTTYMKDFRERETFLWLAF